MTDSTADEDHVDVDEEASVDSEDEEAEIPDYEFISDEAKQDPSYLAYKEEQDKLKKPKGEEHIESLKKPKGEGYIEIMDDDGNVIGKHHLTEEQLKKLVETRELDLKEAEEKKKAEAEELKKLNEQQDLEDFYAPGEMTSASNPSKCCTKLRITGTTNMDSWYQDMMGEFQIYKPMSYMEYLKQGNLTGKYPVYLHKFDPWVPRKERIYPPRVFLYFYLNENPQYPEVECKERGCWIISMYDAAPGNYWFGKKWYYTLTDPTPKCPENLTKDGHKFINLLDGEKYVDEGLKIECVDEAQSS